MSLEEAERWKDRSVEERLNFISSEGKEYRIEPKFDVTQRIYLKFPVVGGNGLGTMFFHESDLRIDVSPLFVFTVEPESLFTENRSKGEKANPAEPIVHEKGSLESGYLTVHYQNGNYKWWELNFRVRDDTAYLSSKTMLRCPGRGGSYIPTEVCKKVREYHPHLNIVRRKPPWWD